MPFKWFDRFKKKDDDEFDKKRGDTKRRERTPEEEHERFSVFFKGYRNIMYNGKQPDRGIAWIVVVALVFLFVWGGNRIMGNLSGNAPVTLRTDELLQQMRDGNVAKISVSITDGSASGMLKDPVNGRVSFQSQVNPGAGDFETLLYQSEDLMYDYTKPSAIQSVVSDFMFLGLQLGIIFGGMSYLMRSGGLNEIIGGDKTGDIDVSMTTPNVVFDDVVGIPEAIEEVSEIVAFLKDPQVYKEAGAKPPRGILLQGPAGCGKTLLARALAGEAGVPFISQSGSDFIEMYVGVGARRMRKVFNTARECQPSIIFIDEIDAIGGNRDGHIQSTDEHLQTINQLLTEMDGFDNTDNIIVIGATNRGASLDPALLRPGRFDRIVTVDQPAKDGRKEILEHYAIGHPFASDIDFDKLAAHTYGFSGAQLEAVMNQAATLAARRAVTSNTQPVITNDDIEEGLSRVISGPAMKSKQMSDKEKKYVAYHEAGHATVQFVLPGCDQVQKISIVSRNIPGVGTAMGYVQSYSEEDSYVPTSEECQDEIAALLAGRASENHFCNVSTAGASDDLQKASKLALRMASDYSFSPDPSKLTELSLAIRGNSSGVQNGSDGYNSDIETAALRFMQVGWKVANDILVANHPVIEAIVGELIANETIDAERIKEIMSENGVEADSWRKEGTDE